MKRKERKALVKRLVDRYEFLHCYETVSEGIKRDGKVVFKIDVQYLTEEEQHQLDALHRFIEENRELNEDEIVAVIRTNRKKFSFLLFCLKKYKNFIQTFKIYGGLIYLKSKIAGDRKIKEYYKLKD